MAEVRLNKYLSEMGICSRREADRLIEAGKVLVDGQPAVMGQKVSEGQEILCDGCPAGREAAVSEPEAGAGENGTNEEIDRKGAYDRVVGPPFI